MLLFVISNLGSAGLSNFSLRIWWATIDCTDPGPQSQQLFAGIIYEEEAVFLPCSCFNCFNKLLFAINLMINELIKNVMGIC